jgi:RND family efflux transporter MFP subunit
MGMLALVTLAIVTSTFRLHATIEKSEYAPAPALTVQLVHAIAKQWPHTFQASGPIAAWQEAIIGSEISGQRLVAINVNVGDAVKKGQVLARYNSDTLLAEQAELLATWQQAESDRKRSQRLKGTGSLSDQQIETYKNQAAIAKANLDAKNLQLHYAAVVAPDDGTISSRTATLGAIGSNGSELFRMIVKDRIEWRGELNYQQLAEVKMGQNVELSLPDGSVAKARIRQLSPSLDTTSRMATAYADIVSPCHARAGMYASGVIISEMRTAIVVPAVSVVLRDGRSYVFTLKGNGAIRKVTQQEVTTGRHQGNDVEITDGVKEGAEVVTQGAGFLNDGDSVSVIKDTGAGR